MQHDWFGSGPVVVWGGILLEGHTGLHMLTNSSPSVLEPDFEILRLPVRQHGQEHACEQPTGQIYISDL